MRQNKGFTLLEILLVITAIGILASIVLVSINPNRQIAQVRNAQRRSDINTIYKALEQYLIDNGSYPNSVNSNYKDICKTGSEQVGGTLSPTTLCDNKADLRALVPTYLASIPTDPSGGEYKVGINGNNKVAVHTVGESNQLIDINFNDIDANNYIAAIELADGQALELEVKIAVIKFIMGLKADGIWEPIKASVIMAGARTLNGALVPLKGTAPTNFNFVAGDYNRKTGLAGNGSTKYLNSNRNNNADPQNSKHIACYQSEPMTVDTRVLMGTSSAITGRTALLRVGNTSARINANGGPSVSGAGAPGFMGGTRSSSSTVEIRNNGVSSSSAISLEVLGSENIGVFATGVGSLFSNPRLSFYSIGESIDLAKLDTRVSQLMTDYANAIP